MQDALTLRAAVKRGAAWLDDHRGAFCTGLDVFFARPWRGARPLDCSDFGFALKSEYDPDACDNPSAFDARLRAGYGVLTALWREEITRRRAGRGTQEGPPC